MTTTEPAPALVSPPVPGHLPGAHPAPEGTAPAYGYPPGYTYPYPYPQGAYPYPRRDRFSAFFARLSDRAPAWLRPAAVTGAVGAAVAYTLMIHPTTGESTCLLRILTGFDCPGCGGTRSAWYLLHGDLSEAARHNAPFVFAVPFLLYLWISWSLRTTFGWRVPRLRIPPSAMLTFMMVWMVWSVLRNLPWAPFNWLYI